MTKITNNLYIGNWTEGADSAAMESAHIDRILSLDGSKDYGHIVPIHYCPLRDQIRGAEPNTDVALKMAVECLTLSLENEDCVFLHCEMGMSRTVAVTAAYLKQQGRVRSIDDGIRYIEYCGHQTMLHPDLKKQMQRLFD